MLVLLDEITGSLPYACIIRNKTAPHELDDRVALQLVRGSKWLDCFATLCFISDTSSLLVVSPVHMSIFLRQRQDSSDAFAGSAASHVSVHSESESDAEAESASLPTSSSLK